MKKILASIFAVMTVLTMSIPAFAAVQNPVETAPAFTIVAGEQTLELSDLPCAPYQEGDTVMVPLRKIVEALGYQVEWNPVTGAITVEDTYVQKATLFNGTETVAFEGKLQVIDMSREIENAAKTIVHNGYTYVPLEFFREFFNDTAVEGTMITVAPNTSELNAHGIN